MSNARKVSIPAAAILATAAALISVGPAASQGCNLMAANAAAAGRGCARAWMDANLKLNDLMAVGSHNSYKTTIPPAVLAGLRAVVQDQPRLRSPADLQELDVGARQIEIDIYYDPKGGRFSEPSAFAGSQGRHSDRRPRSLAQAGLQGHARTGHRRTVLLRAAH